VRCTFAFLPGAAHHNIYRVRIKLAPMCSAPRYFEWTYDLNLMTLGWRQPGCQLLQCFCWS